MLRTQSSPSATGTLGANLSEQVASELGLDGQSEFSGLEGLMRVGETKTVVERTVPLGAPRETQEWHTGARKDSRAGPAGAEGPWKQGQQAPEDPGCPGIPTRPPRSIVLSAGAEL